MMLWPPLGSWRDAPNRRGDRVATRRRAAAQIERAVKVCPPDAGIENNLAWSLLTIKEIHDPKAALTLARRAVRRSPDDGRYEHTLGLALYRTGNLAGAVRSMERSMELRDGGDAFEYIILAMVYAKRQDMKKARAWYDRAVKWRKTKAADNAELLDFEEEARALLGDR
jgi:eukaryotic-like serine/threonine-protein kinase